MEFYNKKEELHLETDVSGVGLRASLLKVKDGIQFLGDEAPGMCRDSLQQHRKRSIGHTIWARKIQLLVLFSEINMVSEDLRDTKHLQIFNAIESLLYIPDCMKAERIKEVALHDEYLSGLADLILCGWPSTKN